MTKELINSAQFDLSTISTVAQAFVDHIISRSYKPFVIGFDAEMGVGKTTFTKALLYSLGVSKDEPIMSPTFTYIHEYEVAGQLYGHLDLYRLENEVDLEELIGRPIDAYRGLIIEWPANGGGLKHLECNLLITGQIIEDDKREFTLFDLSS